MADIEFVTEPIKEAAEPTRLVAYCPATCREAEFDELPPEWTEATPKRTFILLLITEDGDKLLSRRLSQEELDHANKNLRGKFVGHVYKSTENLSVN